MDDPSPSSVKAALVVGPDADVMAHVRQILPEWTIDRAADNAEALSRVQMNTYALVITGENTSGRSDVELLRKIRLVHPHTRMIILTESSTPADVIESIRERAFSYYSKPISWRSLAEMIQLAAEGPCWDDGIEIASATPEWIRLAARCDMNTADRLLQFFHEIAELPEPEKQDVAAAFREMLLNAIEHGGHFDPEQYVEIWYLRARQAVICRVKDPGEGFSLDEIEHSAIANPPDDPLRHMRLRAEEGLRPGGFGLLLTKHMVDEVIYAEKGNEVLLIKYLHATSSKGPCKASTTPDPHQIAH